ncbi:uncharacterized protein LOC106092102 isoform X1 [Stomoxys calcitrans]|uniref:uncharacterized protein LOC106092102 isoform X1 n=1 Tax=Stomoxys calcitrans TaxID=35570 RepID=UPI0027E32547|nr:uncharacterized protein LOC106092102 isoform X1 [Stomoxys calcitrans]
MSTFGPEFDKVWPEASTALQLTEFGKEILEQCASVEKPQQNVLDIEKFKRKSSRFPLEFVHNPFSITNQPKDRYPNIEKQIVSAYPLIHERVLQLYLDFLEHKCLYCNNKEKEIYQNISLTAFVQRLLTKRCASFFGKNDKYLLVSGERGCSSFMDVGTAHEKSPLLLKNVLSYDEIKLSAFLSVSSHSEFLNSGNRYNCRKIEKHKYAIEREGVVIGLTGPRLTRPEIMDYQDIIIAKTQNTKEKGYGFGFDEHPDCRVKDYRQLWKRFYEEPDYLHANVKIDNIRFGPSKNSEEILDSLIMKKRYAISFDTLLLESEARAKEAGKQAFVHVMGIGLSRLWKATDQQEKIFLKAFIQRVQYLLPKLQHIDVLHFSMFHLGKWDELTDGTVIESPTHPSGGIKMFLSKRNPSENLKTRGFGNRLLIVSYASDGNALPGNEFWMGCFNTSSNASTAWSTLVTEIHNPHINTEWVNGDNLHIATEEYGVMHISEYAKKKLLHV